VPSLPIDNILPVSQDSVGIQDHASNKRSTVKKSPEKPKKRCPKGTRRNRKTGICEPVNKASVTSLPVQESVKESVKESVQESVQESLPLSPVPLSPVPLSPVPLSPVPLSPVPLSPVPEPQPTDNFIFPEIDDGENDFLYPLLEDSDFIQKIAQHKEFTETQYDGDIKNIEEEANLMCRSKFELAPHQSFVKNFLSTDTPYNSLLLYHMLGSGKTCSAIGIAEEMRSYLKKMGIFKKIIVVASPNVQQNFKKQLFDDRKLETINGKWFIERTCIGSELLKEINPTNVQGLSRGHVINQIQVLISQYYEFMGYIEFSNYMSRILKFANTNYADSPEGKRKYIRKFFDNQLVIIDEVHNINILDTASTTKLTAKNLLEIAQNADSMRLLFLSATPMYNSPTEIIWLINLMNTNDKRPSIQPGEVFDKDGNFKKDGREILRRKMIGYISFVRGENPYLFPFRVYPDVFAKDRTLQSLPNYPTVQMNKKEIKEPLQHVPVYLNSVGQYQQYVYDYIIESMVNKVYKGERKMPDFENMDSFGYTLLYSPLESLVMTYPNEQMDEIVRNFGMMGDKKIYANSASLIKKMIGKGGLSQIIDYKEDPSVPIRYDFKYKDDILKKYGRIFNRDILPKYGAKIAHVCEKIRESTGIVLVYSQYIDGGIVPMALALEEMGFGRYSATASHNRNLFSKSVAQVDFKTMKTAKEMGKDVANFQQAKYIMITGDSNFSPNNAEDIKFVTRKDNCDGKFVKVILISKAASEGVDFRNIRQIHILQPWYNMNRIEQTIGRGVRNQSHCDLPFNERNVEIYLHASMINKPEEEAADLYVYRMAERKAKQIGQVTRLLKENAVDCVLNIAQTNFTSDKLTEIMANQDIKIHLSSSPVGQMIDNFPVGDRPYSDLCDYMDNCSFKCDIDEKMDLEPKEITTNYSENFLKTNSEVIMSRIRDLFREHSFFTRKKLIESINIVKKYPVHHIYYALSKMVNLPTEELVDLYGRNGYLVNRGNIYAFQPAELLDESATIYERTVPVDYKNSHLRFEIPQKFEMQLEEKEVESSKRAAESAVESSLQKAESQSKKAESSYDKILADLEKQMGYLTTTDQKISASEKNWFKHASLVISILRDVHQIPEDDIHKYATYHYLDILDLHDKLTLANHFYGIDENEPKNNLEMFMKSYIDERIFRKKEGKKMGLMLASSETLFCYERNPNQEWQFLQSNEFFKKYGTKIIEKYTKKEFFKEVGFMDKFQEGDKISMVFKIKTTGLANVNKGAKAESASKKNSIIPKLNAVWGSNSYTDSSLKLFELCIILEILMRYLNDDVIIPGRSANILYFFGPESGIINEIKNK
jgi:superfamily II DNA or RNA helicase